VSDIDTAGIRNALDLGVQYGPGDNVGHLADVCRELCAALDAARLTIKKVREARDDWHARGYMSCAKELSAVLDGAE
jgi:hypothetical protein